MINRFSQTNNIVFDLESPSIAVLLTCYNRVQETMKGLNITLMLAAVFVCEKMAVARASQVSRSYKTAKDGGW
jgi:hypothetical protein